MKKVAPEGTTLYVSPSFEVTTDITPPDPQPTPTPKPAFTHQKSRPMLLSGGSYRAFAASAWILGNVSSQVISEMPSFLRRCSGSMPRR